MDIYVRNDPFVVVTEVRYYAFQLLANLELLVIIINQLVLTLQDITSIGCIRVFRYMRVFPSGANPTHGPLFPAWLKLC